MAEAQVRFLLDTGATWSLINPRVLDRIGIDIQTSHEQRPITTASGLALAAVIQIPTIAMLGVLRPNFEVLAHPLPPSAPIDGLLGLDFLVGLRLTLDMQRGELSVAA